MCCLVQFYWCLPFVLLMLYWRLRLCIITDSVIRTNLCKKVLKTHSKLDKKRNSKTLKENNISKRLKWGSRGVRVLYESNDDGGLIILWFFPNRLHWKGFFMFFFHSGYRSSFFSGKNFLAAIQVVNLKVIFIMWRIRRSFLMEEGVVYSKNVINFQWNWVLIREPGDIYCKFY